MEHPVVIVDYDPTWPAIYEREKALILRAVGDVILAIEHVGSTAVQGLGAKPTIDIMVGLNRLTDAVNCIEPLKRIGYEYQPEHEASIPERRFFRKGPSDVPNQHFHLHMVERTSDFWKSHLLFRDYLRTHPQVAQQYYRLKKALASEYGLDREAYTEAKTSFIESVLNEARVSSNRPRVRKSRPSPVSAKELRLRYVRLPDRVTELRDKLVYRSRRVVVGEGRIASVHRVVFDGEVVMAPGYQIVYFELIGKWFSVGKIRDVQGKFKGYYCDIVTPPRLLADGGLELTDLFLDLWVSPDLRYKVLDEEELEEAYRKGWIVEQLYERAKKELKRLVASVEKQEFPLQAVKRLEAKLNL
jgi:GrpB-like predicted nucleotidyltransferase (UPF0157 family)/predicted RNA-binding protein associated with RNAse of E/G family